MSNLSSVIQPITKPTKKLINHVIFLIDSSGSMCSHLKTVKSVFESTLKEFQTINQDEIYISLYTFNREVKRQIYNQYIQDLKTEVKFSASGATAMKDAIVDAIRDHKTIKSNDKEDHTFLIYTITDGADNASGTSSHQLKTTIENLDDSWTFVALVPTISDSHYAKNAGIPAGNIQIWDVNSSKGFEEVGRKISASYNNYSTMRSQGVRSTSNIFQVNSDNLTRAEIRGTLKEVSGAMYHAKKDYVIKDMVEQFTNKDYVKGSTYYELSKPELVQATKDVVIVSKKDGKKFGGSESRHLLGLPTENTRVKPGDFGDWRIFIQSTSLNRKIKSGTSIFVKE
jgi:uncharacterized protein YegL